MAMEYSHSLSIVLALLFFVLFVIFTILYTTKKTTQKPQPSAPTITTNDFKFVELASMQAPTDVTLFGANTVYSDKRSLGFTVGYKAKKASVYTFSLTDTDTKKQLSLTSTDAVMTETMTDGVGQGFKFKMLDHDAHTAVAVISGKKSSLFVYQTSTQSFAKKYDIDGEVLDLFSGALDKIVCLHRKDLLLYVQDYDMTTFAVNTENPVLISSTTDSHNALGFNEPTTSVKTITIGAKYFDEKMMFVLKDTSNAIHSYTADFKADFRNNLVLGVVNVPYLVDVLKEFHIPVLSGMSFDCIIQNDLKMVLLNAYSVLTDIAKLDIIIPTMSFVMNIDLDKLTSVLVSSGIGRSTATQDFGVIANINVESMGGSLHNNAKVAGTGLYTVDNMIGDGRANGEGRVGNSSHFQYQNMFDNEVTPFFSVSETLVAPIFTYRKERIILFACINNVFKAFVA
jgi:hypothetical protein